MEWWDLRDAVVVIVALCLFTTKGTEGIRFSIDKEECLSHKVEYEGDTVHVSFVVIKANSLWHYDKEGVDLVDRKAKVTGVSVRILSVPHRLSMSLVMCNLAPRHPPLANQFSRIKGPSGEQIQDIRDKTSEKTEFMAQTKGLYRFCFTNKSPYQETVDFDVHVNHFAYFDQHAKDEHFTPLLEQIAKLEEALYSIQFEQHWLEAQTDRQAIVNEGMSRRAIHKAIFEAAALIGASVLQVYLLQRLFERKLGTSRV
uniref:GOLD domain-containing protein n=1 Tax=Fagus sylvatica TaxID=28930 RepID=A0A2N9EJ93_FAGSY